MNENTLDISTVEIPDSRAYLFISITQPINGSIINKYYIARDGGPLPTDPFGILYSMIHKVIEKSTGQLGYFLQIKWDINIEDHFDNFCDDAAKIIFNDVMLHRHETEEYKQTYYKYLKSFIREGVETVINNSKYE
jgi:hypothetical protein